MDAVSSEEYWNISKEGFCQGESFNLCFCMQNVDYCKKILRDEYERMGGA